VKALPRHRKPYAVVIDLHSMAGLQSARILAKRGIPVIGVGSSPQNSFCRTRVCERVLFTDTTSEALIETLEALGPQLSEPAVLVLCADEAVDLVSRHRERLKAWFHIALPDHDTVETLMDKVSFYRLAQERGLAIPPTRFLESRADAEAAARELVFPCVVKPPAKSPRWTRNVERKVFRVDTPEALLSLYDRVACFAPNLIAQEWVEGGEGNLFSCNAYFDADSRPLATFVARKIRQWPPETGVSALGEEVRNDEVLAETIRVFQTAGFHGLAYLEMKRDDRTGRHYIIEPNVGRATGRSAIAEAGGVELLQTMYCDTLGLPLPAGLEQRYTGVKWIHLRWELQAAVMQWWNGSLGLREWLRDRRGPKAYALFSWSDPLPFWLALGVAAREAVREAVRRIRSQLPWPGRRQVGDCGAP
jgi:predicted ATP-grasp superfamily ATP-dependent carboligase